MSTLLNSKNAISEQADTMPNNDGIFCFILPLPVCIEFSTNNDGHQYSFDRNQLYVGEPFDRSKRPHQLIQRDLHLTEIKGDDHARPVMDRDVLVDRQDVGIHLGEAVERFAEDAFFMMQHQ